LEQFVDEGRLAMVNVGDDGDVADVLIHCRDVGGRSLAGAWISEKGRACEAGAL
jgi:hypothetical protein